MFGKLASNAVSSKEAHEIVKYTNMTTMIQRIYSTPNSKSKYFKTKSIILAGITKKNIQPNPKTLKIAILLKFQQIASLSIIMQQKLYLQPTFMETT